jgi:hypothetical protein
VLGSAALDVTDFLGELEILGCNVPLAPSASYVLSPH